MVTDGSGHLAAAIQKGVLAAHVIPPAPNQRSMHLAQIERVAKRQAARSCISQEPEAAFLAKLSMKVFVRSTLELVSSGSSSLSESYMLFIASGVAMPVRE